MHILSQELKLLKEELKIWNKNAFLNVHYQVCQATSTLDNIQQRIIGHGPYNNLMKLEKE